MSETDATFIDPERDRFKMMFDLPLDAPVHMINLLRFRDVAVYAPDDPEAGGPVVSGAAAYARYAAEAGPHFRAVGGEQVWAGTPELMVIGPLDKQWDSAFIAAYPTAQAFIDMLRNPDYQRATRHRRAALLDSRLIRTRPVDGGGQF